MYLIHFKPARVAQWQSTALIKPGSMDRSHPRAPGKGTWRSWLARCFDIAKVTGSNPVVPTRLAIFGKNGKNIGLQKPKNI